MWRERAECSRVQFKGNKKVETNNSNGDAGQSAGGRKETYQAEAKWSNKNEMGVPGNRTGNIMSPLMDQITRWKWKMGWPHLESSQSFPFSNPWLTLRIRNVRRRHLGWGIMKVTAGIMNLLDIPSQSEVQPTNFSQPQEGFSNLRLLHKVMCIYIINP